MKILGKKIDFYGDEKTLVDYECGWCNTEFKQYVSKGGKQGNDGKKGNVSSQVKCPNCGNFLKTWK